MYGLVNIAIKQLVESEHGPEVWDDIVAASGVDDLFVRMDPYPDEITYKLVAAASERLGAPPEELLRAFGRYWILYTAKEGYGEYLDMGGSDLREFLRNLDTMHGRFHASFPALEPPAFRLEECDDGSMRLHYTSRREGLSPMVVGLIEGLGERFETPVEVTTESLDGGKAIFGIRMNVPAAQPA